MATNSTILHHQWASRPSDQRFLSLPELHAFNVAKREKSIQRDVALAHLRIVPGPDNALGIRAVGYESTPPADLSHWAFGQLCQRAQAPAGFLRQLPAELAAPPLQWSMERAGGDARLLAQRDNGNVTIMAATSATYGRIWDAELSRAISERVDLTRWTIPSASYSKRDPAKATTLYASDRDCFVCLVDEQNPVEVPRQGGLTTFKRGFIARNSEVGLATMEISLFLYELICDNRTIWGMEALGGLKIRHTSGGPHRFLAEARPALDRFAESGTQQIVGAVQAAQNKSLGKSDKDVTEWLADRGFTRAQAGRALEAAKLDGQDPWSLWGVVYGLTADARDLPFGDERFDAERKASKLMATVAR